MDASKYVIFENGELRCVAQLHVGRPVSFTWEENQPDALGAASWRMIYRLHATEEFDEVSERLLWLLMVKLCKEVSTYDTPDTIAT